MTKKSRYRSKFKNSVVLEIKREILSPKRSRIRLELDCGHTEFRTNWTRPRKVRCHTCSGIEKWKRKPIPRMGEYIRSVEGRAEILLFFTAQENATLEERALKAPRITKERLR